MNCKICLHESRLLFTKTFLDKYPIRYFQCNHCFFIYTEEAYWLEEAYAAAITSLDIGLIYRNIHYAPIVDAVIKKFFNDKAKILNFEGDVE